MTHILYIEDDKDSIMLVKRVVEAQGHKLAWGFNGKKGIDLANADPGLILLDIRLPDINGYEVARRLRSSGNIHLASVPIIAITAHESGGEMEKALEAGCDLFMTKPIDTHELIAQVETFLPSVKNAAINMD